MKSILNELFPKYDEIYSDCGLECILRLIINIINIKSINFSMNFQIKSRLEHRYDLTREATILRIMTALDDSNNSHRAFRLADGSHIVFHYFRIGRFFFPRRPIL